MSLQSEVVAADVCTRRLEWPDSQIETLINLLQKRVYGRNVEIIQPQKYETESSEWDVGTAGDQEIPG